MNEHFKIGEVAERAGVSVRTLRYYEEIGLLENVERTRSGHRVFARRHVERLLQIKSLQQLGMSLDEVGDVLSRSLALDTVLAQRLDAARQDLVRQQQLVGKLEGLVTTLRQREEVSTDALLETLEVMAMYEEHYTEEQLATLAKRREQLGEHGMEAAQQAWKQLYADVREQMDRGVQPDDPAITPLVDRWNALIEAFTGGDAGIGEGLNDLWQENRDELAEQHGLDLEVMAFMQEALAAH